jgi:hypothetical protein
VSGAAGAGDGDDQHAGLVGLLRQACRVHAGVVRLEHVEQAGDVPLDLAGRGGRVESWVAGADAW